MTFRLPRNDERIAVIGKTGSGKTVLANWVLSLAPFDRQPYVIVDYKHDRLIAELDHIGVNELGLTDKLPKKPGVFVLRPKPTDIEAVEAWMWKVWEQERIGLYFDEMYMVPDIGALKAILTQGRSKKIPAIMLSQRPVWMSRFMLSEADHYSVFKLQHPNDKKTVSGFLPPEIILPTKQDYKSYWYNVKDDASFTLAPVPSEDEILDRFERRLKPRRVMSS